MSLALLLVSGASGAEDAANLYKLEPHRTMHLRGFDGRGAAAALHSASNSGFTASGVFSSPSDFCVLMLWDADNKHEHYTLKYLPDFDHAGIVLEYDLQVANLQPLDDPRFRSIPWADLSYTLADGTSGTVDLWGKAAKVSGSYAAASAVFTLNGAPAAFDRVTLWLQNIAFDFIVGTPPETAEQVCQNLVDQINNANWPSLGPTWALRASRSGTSITLKAARYGAVNTAGTTVSWVSGEKFMGLGAGDTIRINHVDYTVASLVSQTQITLTAGAGAQTGVRYLAERGGYGANHVGIYELHKNTNLYFTPSSAKLSGGSSDATWRVRIDLSALGLPTARQLWLTFAPRLADGAAYTAQEWSATFTNWTVTDPNGKRRLKVAGPGSVRVGNRERAAAYTGAGWQLQDGIKYWQGFSRRSKTTNDKVTVSYSCQYTHDLYLGTELYLDRGIAGIKLDGDAETDLDCYLNAQPGVATRRKVRSGVAAGIHTVEIRVKGTKNAASSDYWVYFDFLEAARAGDVPDPAQIYTNRFLAVDYDTDNGYQLSPQRLVWDLQRLGVVGRVDHYVGVFWWNKRKRREGKFHSVQVTFGGTWVDQDQAFLTIGGVTVGKTVFPADTTSTIVAHFQSLINEVFVGVWAGASANVLTITSRDPLYDFTFSHSKTSAAGTMTDNGGDLRAGTEGVWIIDKEAAPVLNLAARKWHEEYFAELKYRGYECVSALSMELLNPPDDPAAAPAQVWAARYNDGEQVKTSTGFGTEGKGPVSGAANTTPIRLTVEKHGFDTGDSVTISGVGGNTAANGTWTITRFDANQFDLNGSAGNGSYTSGGICVRNLKTTHCAFSTVVKDHLKVAYKEIADLMSAASLPIWVQFGEVLWWFFAKTGVSMAYYDDFTKNKAQTDLGRPLYVFTDPNNDPSVNAYADANLLRGMLKDHVDGIRAHVTAAHAGAKYELLWPHDVNNPTTKRLNRYLNLPAQWETKSGSGLDFLLMEALSYGAVDRNLNNAMLAVRFPYTAPLSWDKADVGYLVPWFNGGCPWAREYLIAVNEQVNRVGFWANDHLHLMGWRLPLPVNRRRSRFL